MALEINAQYGQALGEEFAFKTGFKVKCTSSCKITVA